MAEIDIQEQKEKITVSISGAATIQSASSLHENLKTLIDKGKPVELNLDKISNADISFLQLISALYRSLHEKKQELTFHNDTISGPVHDIIKKSGFFTSPKSALVQGEKCPFFSVISQGEGQ